MKKKVLIVGWGAFTRILRKYSWCRNEYYNSNYTDRDISFMVIRSGK